MTALMFAAPYAEQLAPLADARRAWLAAEFDRCANLCAAAELRSPGEVAAEAGLLRACAMLRLNRAGEALTLLEDLIAAGGEHVRRARVLRGTALVRSGDGEAGVRELQDVLAGDPSAELAGEALLGIALDGFNRRRFALAESALDAVTVVDGSIGARVAEYRGWIAYYSYRLDEAVVHFRLALERNAIAAQPDPSLGANVVCSLAYVATECVDIALWVEVDRWASQVPGLGAPGWHAYRFAYVRSVWLETTGRPADALGAAREAESYASSDALRLIAGCRRAAILFRYGERLAYHDVAANIRQTFEAFDLDAIVAAEEAQLAREVAEALALLGDVEGARSALARREEARPPSENEGDHQEAAIEAYVSGALADAAGETLRARHCYERAFDGFKALGLVRRATMAALLVTELTGDAEAHGYAVEASRVLPPASWIRVRLVRISETRRDPIVSSLTRAQRAVLEMLAAGMSTAEIADARGRSLQTTRNTVSTLLRTFRAQNRQMLVREYLLRKGAPAANGPVRTPPI